MSKAEYECVHEELLQNHSLKLTELEKEVEFKREKIDNLQVKMDEMDLKLDNIDKTLNEIKMQSSKDDTQLELRLTAIETDYKLLKQQIKKDKDDTQKRVTNYFAALGIFLTALSILIAYLLH